MLPTYKNYQEPQVKPPWYNDQNHCDFNKIKGHTTSSCMRLNNIIQDPNESHDINIDQQSGN